MVSDEELIGNKGLGSESRLLLLRSRHDGIAKTTCAGNNDRLGCLLEDA